MLAKNGDDEREFLTFEEGIKHPRFYHISLMLFLGIFYPLYMTSTFKKLALDYLSDRTLMLAGAFGSVGNGFSRVILASLQDKYGFRKVYFCVMVTELLLASTIWSVKKNEYLYPAWIVITFICQGSHFACFPAVTSKIFGIEYGGQIYTIIFILNPISTLASYLLIHFGGEKLAKSPVLFYISCVFVVINIGLLYLLDEQPIRKRKIQKAINESDYK